MAVYNTKYILNYCNKKSTPLRIEILQRDYTGESYIIVNNNQYLQDNDGNFIVVKRDAYDPNRDISKVTGSSNPFSLEYRNDSEGKLCNIMATSANLSFWEDENFNIDDLKTSDETELKINFYYNNVLKWTGFIVPDFFTEDISKRSEVILTASDRIAILKDLPYIIEPFADNNVSIMYIINKCLKRTGLELGFEVILDIQCAEWSALNSRNPLSRTFVNERRFLNGDSDNVNCYDILQKIMKQFNCRLVQRNGVWTITNKQQLELGSGTVLKYDSNLTYIREFPFTQSNNSFDNINSGGQRTIIPVSSITIYKLDLGADRVYPLNGTLQRQSLVETSPYNWTNRNGFSSDFSDLIPITFNANGSYNQTYTDSVRHYVNNRSRYSVVSNLPTPENYVGFLPDISAPYMESDKFNVQSLAGLKTSFDLTIKAIGKPYNSIILMLIMEVDNSQRYYGLRNDGKFYTFSNNNITSGQTQNVLGFLFPNEFGSLNVATEQEFKLSVDLAAPTQSSSLNLNGAKFWFRLYENNVNTTTNSPIASSIVIKEINLAFRNQIDSTPKSTVYETEKLTGNFTKKYDEQNVMFGDYQTFGQNGYFYRYRDDSLSIMYNQDGVMTKNWKMTYDAEYSPLLANSVRQIGKSLGRPLDELNIGFAIYDIDPLGNYQINCIDSSIRGKFIVSSGTIDYMRCQCNVILSEKQNKGVQLNDYIYSEK